MKKESKPLKPQHEQAFKTIRKKPLILIEPLIMSHLKILKSRQTQNTSLQIKHLRVEKIYRNTHHRKQKQENRKQLT